MDRRRGRILAAARSILSEQGLDGFSVRQLAKQSGLVVKTLYNLFGSKENILVALMEQGTVEVDPLIAEAAQSSEGFADVLKAVEQVILAHADVLKPAMIASFHLTGARDSSAMRMHKRRSQLIAAALIVGQENGLVREDINPEKAAWVVYRAYTDALSDWAFGIVSDRGLSSQARQRVLSALHAYVTPEIADQIKKSLAQLQN